MKITSGYKAGTSGEVNAIREEFADEDSVYENFTKDFQRGVVDITPSFMEFVTGRGLQSSDIRQSALNIWREFISFPNRGMVSAYFSLVHNERFGTGVLDVKDKNFDMSLLLKAFISKEAKKELVQKAMRTGWPQAYILANMPFLLRFFNRAVRRRWAEQSV